jgi:purine-binding chemotaxis protein CheW
MTGMLQDELTRIDLSSGDVKILNDRAKTLAKPLLTANFEGESIEVLEFLLNRERYAIPMQYVREVSLLRHLTPLPATPDFILGIISLRGRVVSVTDLRVFFSLPRRGLSDYNKIIVLSGKNMEFAILADMVVGVSVQDISRLSHPPDVLKGIGRDFLSGILPGPLILINAELILTDTRLIVQGSSHKKNPDE